ncbi:CPBP family intramembrane glutamic endopeptidase [Rhodococcus oryzae]|uniref:CPBP family intramembrane glutamic endopeptidase n=1 Tax=Rhodococcus oryzae TaxID=2571143 RepID=UPI0037239ED4
MTYDDPTAAIEAAPPAATPNPDFPYYNGIPQVITGRQWWIIAAAIAVGFSFILFWSFGGAWGHWVPVLVFPALPLLVLRRFAPDHWTAIFRRVGVRDVLLMVGIFVLNFIVTIGVGALLTKFAGAEANPGADTVSDASTTERILFFLQAVPQLLGEELLTILPLLGIMYYCYTKLKWSRRTAMITGWLITALIFGAVHLPTYDWNVVQALLGIGIARLVLSLGFLITKNIWVSTGAHVLNDWAIFSTSLS